MTQTSNNATSGPTVLLVDDNENTLDDTRTVLAREGFNVVAQSSPFGVTNLVRRHKPEVVVLDIMMPGLDGEGLAGLIRREAKIPIVFFSAMQEEHLRDLVRRTSEASYVLKSEGVAFLADEIRKHLRRGSRRAEL